MSDSADLPHVVAAGDLDPVAYDHGRRTFRQYRLAHETVGEGLGASLYELDPGHRTWPAHYHTGNEEAVYVLDGRLTLFLGSGDERTEHRLDPGDFVALPAGPAHARELEGAGDDTARFLVFSTMDEPEFTVLPDDRKAHLVAGDPPGEYADRYVSRTLDLDAVVPYWDDEDDGNAAGDRTGLAPQDPQSWVVAESAVEWADHDYADEGRESHRFRRKQLGAAAGSERLGASLYDVPPGKRTWLPHYHAGNAEAIYVLAGAGMATLGVERTSRRIAAGDYVALPRGERGYHDVAAGDDGLRYLMVSTMHEPDVTVYPDDGKVGLYAGSAPGGDADERTLSTYLERDAAVEYWE